MKPALIAAVAAAFTLSACAERSDVNITSGSRKVQTKSRTEPIFYNGKHYQLAYSFNDAMKAFDMKVSGTSAAMTAAQEKDAVAIATSSLGYFACPDGQRGKLAGNPRFSGGVWSLQARCG
jgi:hypothetical protein